MPPEIRVRVCYFCYKEDQYVPAVAAYTGIDNQNYDACEKHKNRQKCRNENQIDQLCCREVGMMSWKEKEAGRGRS
jgi:hypothetical protein